MKTVYAPSLKRNVAFGRRPEVAPGPSLKLSRYIKAMPPPPVNVDYTQGGTSLTAALSDIYANDQLGCCVIAWLYHHEALWTGNATGTAYHATRDQVIQTYSAVTGYVPGDPATDRGTDMTVAMNWICQNGYPNGSKPLGWLRVDGTNQQELMQAIWLFEGCGFGVGLPDAWISNMPQASGFTWGIAGSADLNNGHAFLGAGYDATGVIIDTWGLIGKFTWAAVAQYATATSGGEIDLLLSPDMIAKATGKAPNGFDWAALVADFDSIGGHVPTQNPVPTPAPTGPLTLAQAQALVTGALGSAFPLLTRSQAATVASNALAKGWPQS